MPITRNQFDNTIDTLSAEVLGFLDSNAEEAFNIEEIAEAVGGRPIEIWAILDSLKQAKEISGKCIKGIGYYCIMK